MVCLFVGFFLKLVKQRKLCNKCLNRCRRWRGKDARFYMLWGLGFFVCFIWSCLWVQIVDTWCVQKVKAESRSPVSFSAPLSNISLWLTLYFFLILSVVIQVAPITFLTPTTEWQLKNLVQNRYLDLSICSGTTTCGKNKAYEHLHLEAQFYFYHQNYVNR